MGSDEARLRRDPFHHTRLPKLTGVAPTSGVAMYRNLPLAKSTAPNSGPFGPRLTTYTKDWALAEALNIATATRIIGACASITILANAAALLNTLDISDLIFVSFSAYGHPAAR